MIWAHSWQLWLNMLIRVIPKIPILMKKSRSRERRMPVQRDRITRRTTGTMVSVRQIIQILWLTPMYRAMRSIVRVNRPSAVEA